MRRRSFVGLVLGLALLGFLAPAATLAESGYEISEPFIHENLAVYLIKGSSRAGPVPLTLQEALDQGAVTLNETGQVSELMIENLSGREVFLQAGDLVKGGKQDRVLSVSLLLPARSGAVPIGAYCVEQGRWGARGSEDVAAFASADMALPSRQGKLAILAPELKAAVPQDDRLAASPQREVWNIVAATQQHLSESLAASVESEHSPSSLQLALENSSLHDAVALYVEALEEAGHGEPDVIGYAVAINGELSGADIYPSQGLFRKLWPKLLKASATEAIAELSNGETSVPPSADAVQSFLAQAEAGKQEVSKRLALGDRLEVRDTAESVYVVMSKSAGAWVHRSYLTK